MFWTGEAIPTEGACQRVRHLGGGSFDLSDALFRPSGESEIESGFPSSRHLCIFAWLRAGARSARPHVSHRWPALPGRRPGGGRLSFPHGSPLPRIRRQLSLHRPPGTEVIRRPPPSASLPRVGRARSKRWIPAGALCLFALFAGELRAAEPLPIPDSATERSTAVDTLDAPDAGARIRSQGVESPQLARGSILFEMRGASATMRGIHGADGRRPLGERFFRSELGTSELPELARPEALYRDLMGAEVTSWTLNLGRIRGRMNAEEQVVPFRIGYGLFDRVTLGVTVPLIRRRTTSSLRLSGDGATVGTNPGQADSGTVNEFLAQAFEALGALEEALAQSCPVGGSSPARQDGNDAGGSSCQEGRQLAAEVRGFIEALDRAYDDELVFPLRGTSGADAITERWNRARSGMEVWGVEGPDGLPLAMTPLGDQAFTSNFVDPAWGGDGGLPRSIPEEVMMMGDVEAHLVLGLLQRDRGEARLGVRSSLVLSGRFPTGVADSLQLLAPMAPPQGVGGVGVRLVSDLVSDTRFALLTVAEGWWYDEAEAVVLAPDPTRLYGELGVARLPVRWTPGSRSRAALTPRFHVTPGLSLGLGYQFDRWDGITYAPSEMEPNGAGDPLALPPDADASSLHTLRGELRYHGMEGVIAEALPFPLEVVMSYEGTLGGSGDLAVAHRRMEAGVRLLLR
jgi:hypothetical protein